MAAIQNGNDARYGKSNMAGIMLFEMLSAFKEIKKRSELELLLKEICSSYGVKTVAYFSSGVRKESIYEYFFSGSYSLEWVKRYKTKGYLKIDPVLQFGMRSVTPVDWSEFRTNSRNIRQFFGESLEFGLGRHGLSFPVHGANGRRSLLSITSDEEEREWAHNRGLYERDFQTLAVHAHEALAPPDEKSLADVHLSPRERECLLWAAEGKTVWESSRILGLSTHTVRFYLESARRKLSASSNTHAVAKAIRHNLLSEFR
jgi:DNA-binding CsgD family transcriptional regulator